MKQLFSVVIVVVISLAGCAQPEVARNKAYLFKSKKELEATEREALAGDNAAAKRMADYYYFGKNDPGNCIWWFKLAASRGDLVAKENLKKLLPETR